MIRAALAGSHPSALVQYTVHYGREFCSVTHMRKTKRTADQLTALIKERAAPFGQWPPKMTILLYPMNNTWEIMVSPGKTVQEEEFRITVLWIATQMAMEFNLRQ